MNSINLNLKWSKRKIISLSVIVFIIILIGSYSIWIKYTLNKWESLIYPGVHIKNIAVGGMTKKKALEIINANYIEKIKNKEIALKYNNLYHYLNLNKLGLKTNVEEALEKAISYGKDLSFINKILIIINPKKINIEFNISIDDAAFTMALDDISKRICKEPLDANLSFNRGGFSIISHKDGISINRDELKKRIEFCIYDFIKDNMSIEIPTIIVNARITQDMLKDINGIISSFSTNFATSEEGRAKNIEKGVEAIDGTIILPGEVFSFNNTVGDTSKERGFFPAPEILYGKLEQGYGGGICQVSTTLYNAFIRANIIPLKRQHHSFPVSYVQEGLDAAIAYGLKDLEIKNTYDYPIYIRGIVQNKSAEFILYSDVSVLNGKTYEYYSTNKVIIPADVVYINDPNLWDGFFETRVERRDGVKCDVHRITYDKNGNILEDKFVYKDTYPSVNEVIAIGSKKR